MKVLLIIALAALPFGCLSKPAAPTSQADMSRLFHRLFDKYEKYVMPVKEGGDPIKVKFGIAPICFQLSPDGILKSEMWMRYVWNDPRFAVETDIPVMRINPSFLWKPDVTLYNRADTWNSMFPDGKDQSQALIYPSNGEVLWVPPVFQEARCVTDLDDFWGEQTCTLKFGSWTYDGLKMDLDFYNDDKKADVSDYSDNCPVKVLSSTGIKEVRTYDCCEEPYPSLLFNVTLQRQYVVTEQGILRNPRLPYPR